MTMDMRIRREGGTYSKFVQMMRETGYNKSVNVELATVVAAAPNLQITLDADGLTIDKDDLIVMEHLTRHERVVTLEHVELTERDLGDGIGIDHLDTDDLAAPVTTYKHSYVKMTFEDVLKVGDRVAVVCLDEDMVYMVIDRAVWNG